jgi:hypothetical protein
MKISVNIITMYHEWHPIWLYEHKVTNPQEGENLSKHTTWLHSHPSEKNFWPKKGENKNKESIVIKIIQKRINSSYTLKPHGV